MSRKERMERAEEIYAKNHADLVYIAIDLSNESEYTMDECMDHLRSAVIDETEKLLGGGR